MRVRCAVQTNDVGSVWLDKCIGLGVAGAEPLHPVQRLMRQSWIMELC